MTLRQRFKPIEYYHPLGSHGLGEMRRGTHRLRVLAMGTVKDANDIEAFHMCLSMQDALDELHREKIIRGQIIREI